MNKAPRRPLSIAQIDSLLLSVERFNPNLQDRVLSLVDNPTQCSVLVDTVFIEELTEDSMSHLANRAWENRSARQRYFDKDPYHTYACCSCYEMMIVSTSILCPQCWEVEPEVNESAHDPNNTYEDNGTLFFELSWEGNIQAGFFSFR